MASLSNYVGNVRDEFPALDGLNRLRALILYVSSKYKDDEFFGATRLNKVLFEIDHTAFRKLSSPVTGIVYVKEKQGPVPRNMQGILRDMQAEGQITIRHVPHRLAPHRKLRRVEPCCHADIGFLSAQELNIVDAVITARWGESADSASARTHGLAWQLAEMREPIPYESAFLSDEPITQQDIERTEELSKRFGWESF